MIADKKSAGRQCRIRHRQPSPAFWPHPNNNNNNISQRWQLQWQCLPKGLRAALWQQKLVKVMSLTAAWFTKADPTSACLTINIHYSSFIFIMLIINIHHTCRLHLKTSRATAHPVLVKNSFLHLLLGSSEIKPVFSNFRKRSGHFWSSFSYRSGRNHHLKGRTAVSDDFEMLNSLKLKNCQKY